VGTKCEGAEPPYRLPSTRRETVKTEFGPWRRLCEGCNKLKPLSQLVEVEYLTSMNRRVWSMRCEPCATAFCDWLQSDAAKAPALRLAYVHAP
jgi:hypothetical protein